MPTPIVLKLLSALPGATRAVGRRATGGQRLFAWPGPSLPSEQATFDHRSQPRKRHRPVRPQSARQPRLPAGRPEARRQGRAHRLWRVPPSWSRRDFFVNGKKKGKCKLALGDVTALRRHRACGCSTTTHRRSPLHRKIASAPSLTPIASCTGFPRLLGRYALDELLADLIDAIVEITGPIAASWCFGRGANRASTSRVPCAKKRSASRRASCPIRLSIRCCAPPPAGDRQRCARRCRVEPC